MNLDERRSFLSHIGIFARCKRGDLKALARSCDEMTFETGEIVCRQGEKGAAMFLVIEGGVDVVEETDEGEMPLAYLGHGAVIGELSVIDGEMRSATVRARERTTCLVLTTWDLRASIKERPEIALDILQMVIGRYRTLTDKLKHL